MTKAQTAAGASPAKKYTPTADRDIIERHLRYLFGGLDHSSYEAGKIEIGTATNVRFFGLREIGKASKWAADLTEDHEKVYVHCGLIRPDYEKVLRAGNGEHVGHSAGEAVMCWPFVWGEADHGNLDLPPNVSPEDRNTQRLLAFEKVAADHGFAWGWLSATGTVPSLRIQGFARLASPIAPDDPRFFQVVQSVSGNGCLDTGANNSSQVLRLCGTVSWTGKHSKQKEAEKGEAPRVTEPVRQIGKTGRTRIIFDALHNDMQKSGKLLDARKCAKLSRSANVDDLKSKIVKPDDFASLDRAQVREWIKTYVAQAAEGKDPEENGRSRRDGIIARARTIGGLLWTDAFGPEEIIADNSDDDGDAGLSLVLAYEINGGSDDNGFNALDKGVLDAMTTGASAPLRKLPEKSVTPTGDAFGAVEQDETASFEKIEAIRWAADNGVTIDAGMLYDLRCALEDDGVKAETAGVMCRALSEHGPGEYALGETDDLLGKMADKARKAREKTEKTGLPAMLFRSADDIAENFKPMDWSIRGLLPRRGIGFFIAPSHAGKSFAVIDLAGHLGQGSDWLGHKIAGRYCVLYVTGEGRDGINQRLRAWILRNGATHGNVAVMECPPNLFADANAEARIVAAAKALMNATGNECALIVFDTLASLCTGMDENSAQDVGRLTKRMRAIAEKTDAAIMVVHHTGVTNQTRGRGSSAFFGNGDFEFQINVDEKTKERRLKNSKQRDDERNEKGHPFTFTKVQVGEYEDDNEPIYSLVFVASQPPDASAFGSVADDDDEQDDAPDLGEGKGKGPALKPLDARVLALAGEFDRPFSRNDLQERYNRTHGKAFGVASESSILRVLKSHRGSMTRMVEAEDNKKTLWEMLPTESV